MQTTNEFMCPLKAIVFIIDSLVVTSITKNFTPLLSLIHICFTVAVAVIRGFERGLFHTLLLIYAVVVSLV